MMTKDTDRTQERKKTLYVLVHLHLFGDTLDEFIIAFLKSSTSSALPPRPSPQFYTPSV